MNRRAIDRDRSWRPRLGAFADDGGICFRVWAPTRETVELVLDPQCSAPRRERLAPTGDGTFSGTFDTVTAGDLYSYLLDGDGPYPDPCSRFQPHGVHGPSAAIDPAEYEWSDRHWTGVPLERAVIHELHVGTFTPAGTFEGVTERLAEDRPLLVGPGAWGSSRIVLPAAVRATGYRHVITGECCEAAGSDQFSLSMATALRTCPVALLWAPVSEEAQADAA